MSLTRKMLNAMEIDEAKIEQIIQAHKTVIDEIAAERDKYKADVEKYKAEAERLEDVEKQLEKANIKLEDAKETKQKLSDLKKEFEDYKVAVDNQSINAKKEKAYRALLSQAGVSEKRFDSIIKITDLTGVELDEDGNLKDVETLKNNIKSEWADFIVTQSKQGASVANPPQNTGGSVMPKEDIMKITDTQKRQEAWSKFLENERKN